MAVLGARSEGSRVEALRTEEVRLPSQSRVNAPSKHRKPMLLVEDLIDAVKGYHVDAR